jgi:hypothetical protein
MLFRFLRNLLRRKPKPSDYIGKTNKEAVQTILAAQTLKDCLMRKNKKQELQIIRELNHDEQEIRRMP